MLTITEVCYSKKEAVEFTVRPHGKIVCLHAVWVLVWEQVDGIAGGGLQCLQRCR